MTPIHKALVTAAFILEASALAYPARAQPTRNPGELLERGFANPPESAKPRTWWHWTNGNVTKEGITKDLEWMKRVGIGGIQLADVGFGGGQTSRRRSCSARPEWLDAVRHAAAEADRLGLEMTIFSSAGWSETGGPWVKPEQAMKKLVWSETAVEGPQAFPRQTPAAAFQHRADPQSARRGRRRGARDARPHFYGDSAVIAYRTPADESRRGGAKPTVTTSGGPIDGAALIGRRPELDRHRRRPRRRRARVGAVSSSPSRSRPARSRSPARGGIPVRPHARQRRRPGTSARSSTARPAAVSRRHGAHVRLPRDHREVLPHRDDRRAARPGRHDGPGRPQPADAVRAHRADRCIPARGSIAGRRRPASTSLRVRIDPHARRSPPHRAIPRARSSISRPKMAKDGTLELGRAGRQVDDPAPGLFAHRREEPPGPADGSGYEVDKLSRKHVEAYFHGYFDPLAESARAAVRQEPALRA